MLLHGYTSEEHRTYDTVQLVLGNFNDVGQMSNSIYNNGNLITEAHQHYRAMIMRKGDGTMQDIGNIHNGDYSNQYP